jgi:glucose-6-phosphate 1-dehydrogenase
MDTFKKELSTVADSTSLIPDLSAAKTPTEVKKGVFVNLGYGNVAKVKTLPALYQLKCQDDIGRDTQQHPSYLKLKGDVTDVKFIINQLLLPKIAELEGKHNLSGNRIYYLALPPQFLNATIKALGEAGLFTDRTNKIVVEKPVGKDSAKEIIDATHQYCLLSQVYFLDHYNGKESIRILECMKSDQTWFVSAWSPLE